ncbi:hypothetical protein K488DRAFT_87528 [Vararia minispora EC-137]|uniref:Uncharacterized protein n=1 Tax=Vararia minispora EC-137 TaxID=1314806 RepID=A0ACB8QG96_9AGAM|nr:hypothetical protein K488DRAFT_87528 [Vararia minispora EC-137]
MRWSLPDEVVADSEPEREHLRSQLKAAKKQQAQAHATLSSDIIDLTGTDIIFILDAFYDVLAESSSVAGKDTSESEPIGPEPIIDISDEDTPVKITLPVKSGTPTGIARLSPPTFHVGPLAATSASDAFEMITPSEENRSDTDDESEGFRRRLGRFTFQNYRAGSRCGSSKIRTSSTISLQSSSDSFAPPLPRPKTASKYGRADFLGGFTDGQFAKVSKCVCCDVKWTARKTRVQKAAHILGCSRKQGLSCEVVEGLIRSEIASVAPQVIDRKTKNAPTPIPAEPTTHMEDIVNRVHPKKSRRHPVPNMSTTVQHPTESHDIIIGRARLLLAEQPTPYLENAAARLGKSRLNSLIGRHSSPPPPESTQPFGQSALAQRLGALRTNTNTVSLWDVGHTEVEDDDAPPTTQAFAPSRLGQKLKHTKLPVSPARPPSSRSVLLSSRSGSVIVVDSSSASEHSPLRRKTKDRRESDNSSPHTDCSEPSIDPSELQFDDTYLHFDSDAFPMPLLSPHAADICVTSPPHPIVLSPLESEATAPLLPKINTGWDASTAKQKQVKMDNETFRARFKASILADSALYSRILRYEPVHFDVFYSHAVRLGASERALKAKVRAVLDEEAISFYGADMNRRRRLRDPGLVDSVGGSL